MARKPRNIKEMWLKAEIEPIHLEPLHSEKTRTRPGVTVETFGLTARECGRLIDWLQRAQKYLEEEK